ncbi:MAG: phosphotransferase family protein [Aeromicrobium sp.]
MTVLPDDAPGVVDTAPEGLDLDRLAPFLGPAVDGLAGTLRGSLIAGGRSNPTYHLTDGDRQWILRRPPYGLVLPTAHDMGRERRIISALAGTAVPVPRVVAHSDDPAVLGAPFYVMDRLDGRTFRDHADTAEMTVAQRAALSGSMIDTLVSLHELDPAERGLGDWGRPDGYLERQLRRWRRQWDSVRTREIPEVDILLDRLASALPTSRFPGIVHGDYKIDNVMVDRVEPSRILGLLDWEMSTLGDTLSDLGLLISFWDQPGEMYNPITAGATAHEGFPTRDELIDAYATRRGVDLPDINWYLVFADFKIAVILEQIHARHLEGNTTGDWFDDIGGMVVPLVERAMQNARSSADAALRP